MGEVTSSEFMKTASTTIEAEREHYAWHLLPSFQRQNTFTKKIYIYIYVQIQQTCGM